MRDDKLTNFTVSQSDYHDGFARGYKAGREVRASVRFASFMLGFALCWFITEVLRHVA